MIYWQNMRVHAQLFFLSTPNFSILKLCSYQPSCWAHEPSGCTCTCQQKKKKRKLTNIDWENIYNSCKKQFKQFPATNISKPCLHPVSSVILQCSYKQKARIILLPNTINYFSIAADNSKPTTKTKPLQYCTQQQPKENYSSTAPSTANQQLERYAQRNTSPTGAHA